MKRKILCFLACMLVVCVPVLSVAGTTHDIKIMNRTFSEKNNIKDLISVRSDWMQIAKITASDAAPERIFGYSVSIDGDYAVVGEGFNYLLNGSAYIFKRNGTTWTQEAKLIASDSTLGKNFGYSVAINNNSVIIGAPGDNEWTGAAYVFTRSGTTWTQAAKLLASDGIIADEFGFSVSINGDYVVVGASYAGDSWAGSAYIFKRTGTTWNQEAKLSASDGQPEDQFGWSVSLSGDTAVVGSVYDDARTGSAYVFTRTDITWTEQQKLTASDAALEDAFGVSVSIDGDTVVVGAGWKDTFIGAAYIYTRSGTTWTQEAKINASDGTNGNEFGMSVSISGSTVVVGARFVNVWTGAAYIYSRTGTAWTEEARINGSDGEYFDQFGWTVAIDGNYVIAGAPGETSPNTGAAYIFWKLVPAVPELNITVKGGFGISVNVNNTGTANATNVNMTITVAGGLFFFGKNTTIRIPSINVNQTVPVKAMVLGFGKTTITISVTCDEGISAERTVNGTIFLVFVFGVK